MSGVVIPDELVGVLVSARHKVDNYNNSVTGTIIDETQNMIVVRTQGKQKKLIKNQYMFVFEFQQGPIHVDGKDLVSRPEERIKKWLKKKK